MKFETYIHNIVNNYQKKFRKDRCTHVHARCVNVRARVLPRRNERAQGWPYRFWHGGGLVPPHRGGTHGGGQGSDGGGLARNSRQNSEVS